MGTIRRGERCDVDAKVDRAAGVGADEQLLAAIVDAVAHTGLARRDQAWHRRGLRAVDQPLLRRLLVAAGDDAEAAAGALLDGGEPAGVLLLVDQHVIALLRAQAMPEAVPRPVVLFALD